jgi:hypothetical protein
VVAENFVSWALLRYVIKTSVERYGYLLALDGLSSKNANVHSKSRPELGPLLKGRYEFYLWDADVERYPWVKKAFREHVKSLLAFRRMAEDYGAKFVLIVHNIPNQGLHGELRTVLWRELPYVYDVGPFISRGAQGRPSKYRFNNHWNKLGNRLATEGIYEYLTRSRVF